MNGRFVDLMAAADFIGPGAVEVERYQTEIFDIVRRRGAFRTADQAGAGDGASVAVFRGDGDCGSDGGAGFMDPRNIAPVVQSPTRIELAVPLKALVSQINYNLFDLEVTAQQSQFAYLQAKDLADAVDGLLRTHDVALWNGTDTSLSVPTTTQYFGAIGQIEAGGNTVTVAKSTGNIVQTFRTAVAQMVANASYQVRPTAIYANPMLLDLIDQEMKSQFNVVLNTVEVTGGFRVKALSTQAGDLPLIPEWALGYTGTLGSGAVLAGVHRDRGPDRVSLADRSESASVQARAAGSVDATAGGGEVRGSGGKGGELCALRSEGDGLGRQWPGVRGQGSVKPARWSLVGGRSSEADD